MASSATTNPLDYGSSKAWKKRKLKSRRIHLLKRMWYCRLQTKQKNRIQEFTSEYDFFMEN